MSIDHPFVGTGWLAGVWVGWWLSMDGSLISSSAQLLQANERLLALRQAQCLAAEGGDVPSEAVNGLPWEGTQASASDDLHGMGESLPQHLGWGSRGLTAVLRRRQQTATRADDLSWIDSLSAETTTTNTPKKQSKVEPLSAEGCVKLYPDIGLGMLRQEQTAPGRLWLMLRYLDQEGRGLLRVVNLTQTLTDKTSALRFCGKRQLRNLLQDGEGIFWTRDRSQLWLRSAAKVAYALDVQGLAGRPVALPVTAMLDGIGAFRAHLYAAFHSGRTREIPSGERVMPIARDTLAGLSGVGRSSQRAYEERVGVQVQANFAVGEAATKERQEQQAWQQGRALFELKDYRGQQGKKGKTYLAWQLPNSYAGQHQHRPKGRQKRINRELKDLVMKGMPGNGGGLGEAQQPVSDKGEKLEKTYFPDGKLAANTHSREPERELYWKRHGTRNGRFDLWQQLGGEG